MEKEVEELTLLLVYLTSWEEKGKYFSRPVRRSWKNHRFEILDKLKEKGFIAGSSKGKSVYLTEEGIDKAKGLQKKYKIKN